jgi:hypothetical protein
MSVDSQNSVNKWKNHFSPLLNVHSVSDVRQIQIHETEPSVPVPISFKVEIAIAKLKEYKSPVRDQIPEEIIQAGGEI